MQILWQYSRINNNIPITINQNNQYKSYNIEQKNNTNPKTIDQNKYYKFILLLRMPSLCQILAIISKLAVRSRYKIQK